MAVVPSFLYQQANELVGGWVSISDTHAWVSCLLVVAGAVWERWIGGCVACMYVRACACYLGGYDWEGKSTASHSMTIATGS